VEYLVLSYPLLDLASLPPPARPRGILSSGILD